MKSSTRASAPIDLGTAIGILGAGSWGTALAVHLAQTGRSVVLRGRSDSLMRAIAKKRHNPTYLPNVEIPREVEATADIRRVAGCPTVLVVVPSHGFRAAVRELFARALGAPLAGAGVGHQGDRGRDAGAHEPGGGRGGEVVAPAHRVRRGVGPHVRGGARARQSDRGGGGVERHASWRSTLQEALSGRNLRLYSSADLAGVELAGAVKNVIAIAAGVVTGLGLGHNTLAALITRGLHEMSRLGVACGGNAGTFSGLAGLGDLVLTCTGVAVAQPARRRGAGARRDRPPRSSAASPRWRRACATRER